jgi:hypothetical protein
MRRIIVVPILAATLLVFGTATAVFAQPSPNGPGQPGAPGVQCGVGDVTAQPIGFGTDGFANAGAHYAGSPDTPSALHAQSDHAVSQYDIACFQQTVNH